MNAATPSDPHSAEAKRIGALIRHPRLDPIHSDVHPDDIKFIVAAAREPLVAEVAELKAKIAELEGDNWEWGIALDIDHISSATSWGTDEAGARHRASKYRDYVVVKRLYGQDDDAWVAVCDHYEDCPNPVVAGNKYCGNHDPYRSASFPVEGGN